MPTADAAWPSRIRWPRRHAPMERAQSWNSIRVALIFLVVLVVLVVLFVVVDK